VHNHALTGLAKDRPDQWHPRSIRQLSPFMAGHRTHMRAPNWRTQKIKTQNSTSHFKLKSANSSNTTSSARATCVFRPRIEVEIIAPIPRQHDSPPSTVHRIQIGARHKCMPQYNTSCRSRFSLRNGGVPRLRAPAYIARRIGARQSRSARIDARCAKLLLPLTWRTHGPHRTANRPDSS
jgi:hypothetical protein